MQTVLNTSAEESPDKAIADATHTITGLIGYLPELQFYQLLHIDTIVETRPIEELHTLWKAATDYCARLTTSPSSTFSITPLPKTLESFERELRQRPTYARYYASYRFCLVPVQELITPQWHVNLEYVEALKQRAPQPDDIREALDFVCDEGGIALADPCVSNVGGVLSLAFQVPNYRELAAILSPLRPLEVRRLDPWKFALTVNAEVQLKPNYLHLAKIGTRLLILNGVHRSLALMLVGWKTIPCLVRDVPHTTRSLVEIGFPPNAGLLPDELLLRAVRPAYLTDYLDPLAALHFQQKDLDLLWQVIPQLPLNKQPMLRNRVC